MLYLLRCKLLNKNLKQVTVIPYIYLFAAIFIGRRRNMLEFGVSFSLIQILYGRTTTWCDYHRFATQAKEKLSSKLATVVYVSL